MKHYLQHSLLLVVTLLFFQQSKAQLSGIVTIDNSLPASATNFINFGSAIDSLHSQGVAPGGVTFQITAGQFFMEAPLSLYNVGSATAPVVFEKIGSGTNPTIMPFFPGTKTITGAGEDGDYIFRIAGGSHITFNGINLQANPSFMPADSSLEYGFYLTKIFDGVQYKGNDHITISNCVIDMNSNPIVAKVNSVAVYASNNDTSGTAATITTTQGRNQYINVVRNNMLNVYHGVLFRGFDDLGMNKDLYDHHNRVDTNTIAAYGGIAQTNGITFIYNDSNYIHNNSISLLTFTPGAIYGIFNGTADGGTSWITNNIVGLISPAVDATVVCILNLAGNGGGQVKISNNSFNCTAHGSFTGIQNVASNRIQINGNAFTSVVNLATAPAETMIILNVSPSADADIFDNSMSGIVAPGTGNNGGIIGIFCIGDTVNIYRNRISDLFHMDPTAYVCGINAGAQVTNIYNNYVYDLKATNSTLLDAVEGIRLNSGNNKLYFNTVVLNTTSSSATDFGTSAVYANTAANVELVNNILVNKSFAGPTGGYTSAYRRSGTSLTTHAAVSNNNCLLADTGSRHALYYDGTNADTTLAQYKARFTNGAETVSFSERPPFTNDMGTPYDLTMQTSVPTLCESGGKPVAMVSADFFGNTRNVTTPDVGAEEGSFTVMPVSMLKLSASKAKKDVIVNWATASELNSNRFEVERSVNGKTWELTGKVKAAGNSNSVRYYAYTDMNAANLAPVIYYRLKMIDHDGSFEYSAVVSVSANKEEKVNALLVPNPFNGEAFIHLNTDRAEVVSVTVTDLAGKQLASFTQQLSAGDNVLQIEKASAFETGIYLVLIETGNEKQVLKLIKQ